MLFAQSAESHLFARLDSNEQRLRRILSEAAVVNASLQVGVAGKTLLPPTGFPMAVIIMRRFGRRHGQSVESQKRSSLM